jgi:hypothetical protein
VVTLSLSTGPARNGHRRAMAARHFARSSGRATRCPIGQFTCSQPPGAAAQCGCRERSTCNTCSAARESAPAGCHIERREATTKTQNSISRSHIHALRSHIHALWGRPAAARQGGTSFGVPERAVRRVQGMIEVICNDRLGKKIRVKCNPGTPVHTSCTC